MLCSVALAEASPPTACAVTRYTEQDCVWLEGVHSGSPARATGGRLSMITWVRTGAAGALASTGPGEVMGAELAFQYGVAAMLQPVGQPGIPPCTSVCSTYKPFVFCANCAMLQLPPARLISALRSAAPAACIAS